MKEKRLSFAVSLSEKTDSNIRRALICRTGSFDGLFGPVTVTKEMLDAICSRYLAIRASPTNENDYAPILLDHNRQVDLIMGRLLAEGMHVAEWKKMDGEMVFGLFADLRIDDPEAQKKVEAGKYAHLSITFDEDKFEIFEVSFVAVEAARGSIVLSHGGGKKMSGKHQLTALSQRQQALAVLTKESRNKRRVQLAKLITEKNKLVGEAEALLTKSESLALGVKTAQLKAKFNEFVRGGKMTPAELKELDIKALSGLPESALKVVLTSYEKRAVSKDVFQFGQSGQDVKVQKALTKENMKKAMELQSKGENGITLAADDEKPEHKEMGADKEEKPHEMPMSGEEWMKCLADMDEVHAKLSEICKKMKSQGEETEKLAADEDKDEKKEMAAEQEEDKKLAAAKEEDEKEQGDKK